MAVIGNDMPTERRDEAAPTLEVAVEVDVEVGRVLIGKSVSTLGSPC